MDGQVAAVTGAGRGIGRATALALSTQGARVALIDADEVVQETAALVRAGGGQVLAFAADITDRQQVDAAIAQVLETWGQIDALVNNAGIHETVAVLELRSEQFERMMRINVIGMFNVTQAVLPAMTGRRRGAIVCLASLAGRRGHPTGGAHYAASKGAVIAFARSIAKEMGVEGIRVNCIAPGVIDTRMMADYTEEERVQYSKTIPLGHFGQPEDVADVATFLCSDASRFMTGQVLNVCGGSYMA